MNESAKILKPDPVVLVLNDIEYELRFNLNAFCEMEKIYESVDYVLQMLLGQSASIDSTHITYCGADCRAEDILVDGVSLVELIGKLNTKKQAKHSDTRNLLWLATLHNHTIYNEDGDVEKYTISKHELGELVSFANLRHVNSKITTALLRDLIPAVQDVTEKNANQAQLETPST